MTIAVKGGGGIDDNADGNDCADCGKNSVFVQYEVDRTVFLLGRALHIYNTKLTGDIPTSIGSLTALQYVRVTSQQRT